MQCTLRSTRPHHPLRGEGPITWNVGLDRCRQSDDELHLRLRLCRAVLFAGMPPPSFTSQSAYQINAPRATISLLKEATQQVYALVEKGAIDGAAPAMPAIHALLTELRLHDEGLDVDVSVDAPSRSTACEAVADRFQSDLMELWANITDKSVALHALMLQTLEASALLLGPARLMAYWPDALLWPALALELLSAADAARVNRLCVFVMRSVPMSMYEEVPTNAHASMHAKVSHATPGTKLHAATGAHGNPEAGLDKTSGASVSVSSEKPASLAAIASSSKPILSSASAAFTAATASLSSAASTAATTSTTPTPSTTAPTASVAVSHQAAEAMKFTQLVFDLFADRPAHQGATIAPALHHLDAILSLYSESRPMPFLHHVATTLSPTRVGILNALIRFVQHHSMHIYHITSTHLMDKLFTTLMELDSPACLHLGIKCLVMILPHIPAWLARNGAGGLAHLLRVYAHVIMCLSSASTACSDTSRHVRLLFTMIYGLFPCQFLFFLRSPASCLAQLGDPEAWDDAALTSKVQSHSLALLQCHFVHPSLAMYDASSEQRSRTWQSQDVSDLTARCLRLYAPPPTQHDNEREPPLPITAELPSTPYDVLLVQNELRFELYMKEQLLMHIGHLHRDRITDTASEAEHQHLQHTIRTLRAQLQGINARFDRQRAEMQAANARHMQWERELNAKLNSYRDERRAWTVRVQNLERELEQARRMTKSQADVISSMGARLFTAQSDLAMAAPKLARLQRYDASVHRLEGSLSEWEDKLTILDQQREEMNKLLLRFRGMELAVVNSERSARQHSQLAESLSFENEQLQRDLHALRTKLLQQHERVQALEEQRLRALSTPQVSMDDVRALRSKNEQLELELLDCRAQLELRALEQKQCEPRGLMTPYAHETTLFSPNTLRTPQDASREEDHVPPLSLGPPAQ